MAYSCPCGFKSNLKFSVEKHKVTCNKALKEKGDTPAAQVPLLSAVDGKTESQQAKSTEDRSSAWRWNRGSSPDVEKGSVATPMSQTSFSAATSPRPMSPLSSRRNNLPATEIRPESPSVRISKAIAEIKGERPKKVIAKADVQRVQSTEQVSADVNSSHPQLARGQSTASIQSSLRSSLNGRGDAPKEPRINASPPTSDSAIIEDVVQFNSPEYFVSEGESKLKLYLMRIGGDLNKEASVDWETCDVTAQAGEKYTKASDTLKFAPGQDHAEIEVEILDNDLWETTKEFKVKLTKGVNCTLGRYLFETRIIIIDDDTFPSNKHAEEILEGEEGIEKIPNRVLMWEFLRHCVETVPGVGRRSAIIVVMDQMHNMYYLLKTYLISIYLVDVVFAKEPKGALWAGTQERTAMLVAFLLVVPLFVTHYWDYQKVQMNLSGDLCTYFQTCLFTRYFNYTDKARRRTPTAEIQYAINKEALEMVENGFMKCFEVLNMIGKLCIFVAFCLRENPSALWVCTLYPVCTAGWLFLRLDKLVESSEECVKAENEVANKVQMACHQYRLVSDYGRRPMMAKILRREIEAMNLMALRREAVACTSEKFTSWLSTILISLYIIIYSRAVLEERLSLGTFLAMVKLFSELGENFEESFSLLMDFFSAIGPLHKVTRFLNTTVDLEASLTRTRSELNESLKLRRQIREKDPSLSSQASVDSIPILIDAKMQFNYSQFEGGNVEDAAWILRAQEEIIIHQGKLVSIFGPHSCGKATMVRVLSGHVFPTSGHICVPSHLRRLHVSQASVLLEDGLWGNLMFGLASGRDSMSGRLSKGSDKSPSLANDMLRLLHRFQGPFSDLEIRLQAEIEDESLLLPEATAAWRDTLTNAHCALICILRGIVMNPEMMVVDRPLIHFAGSTQHTLMRIFKEHISEKGWMSEHAMKLRRPRTVVFSTDYPWAAEAADVQLQLSTALEGGTKISTVSVKKDLIYSK